MQNVVLVIVVLFLISCGESESQKPISESPEQSIDIGKQVPSPIASQLSNVEAFRLVTMAREKIVMPELLNQHLRNALQSDPIRSNITTMPAAPIGVLKAGDIELSIHGNAVIFGKGENEVLWHSPVIQLIGDAVSNHSMDNAEKLLEELNAITDADIQAVKMRGPGAYEGGTGFMAPAQWSVSHPQ